MTIAEFEGSGKARTMREVPQRAKARLRAVLEIGTALGALVLIMIGALAVRFVLSLPHGIIH
jgi:hypothetical protein